MKALPRPGAPDCISTDTAKVREAARVVVETPLTEAQVAAFATVSSYPSLFRRFAAYWIRERDEGRLPLWPEPGESSVKPG